MTTYRVGPCHMSCAPGGSRERPSHPPRRPVRPTASPRQGGCHLARASARAVWCRRTAARRPTQGVAPKPDWKRKTQETRPCCRLHRGRRLMEGPSQEGVPDPTLQIRLDPQLRQLGYATRAPRRCMMRATERWSRKQPARRFVTRNRRSTSRSRTPSSLVSRPPSNQPTTARRPRSSIISWSGIHSGCVGRSRRVR